MQRETRARKISRKFPETRKNPKIAKIAKIPKIFDEFLELILNESCCGPTSPGVWGPPRAEPRRSFRKKRRPWARAQMVPKPAKR